MIRVICLVLLGLSFIALAVYLIYVSSQDTGNGRYFFLIGFSFFILILGVFILIYAGKLNNAIFDTMGKIRPELWKRGDKKDARGSSSLLERNNELLEDWTKTLERRDKMKLLKISEAARESAEK